MQTRVLCVSMHNHTFFTAVSDIIYTGKSSEN